jgi:hypothetical protein
MVRTAMRDVCRDLLNGLIILEIRVGQFLTETAPDTLF